MSRSGTLQDAIRHVDEFQRASIPPRSSAIDLRDDRKEQVRHHRQAKSSKSDRRTSKSSHSKEESRSKKGAKSKRNDESSDDKVDDAKDRKRSERKKERRERRKDRKSRKVERKKKEEGNSVRRKGKWQENTNASEEEDFLSGSESSASEDSESAFRAKQIAKGIDEEFPDVMHDLQQLLRNVDDGQAVDISELPSKRLITLLKQLFESLGLRRQKAEVYLLPSGSQPTLQRLGGIWIAEQLTNDIKPRNAQESIVDRGEFGSVGRDSGNLRSDIAREETPAIGPTGPPGVQTRRVMGPAMPPLEVLEAAAKLKEPEETSRFVDEDFMEDMMIGPPPPAAVAEASSANDAERFEEVTRIMAHDVGDAYDILGLKRGVTANDLKKRYWKLSLLVHPDKCQHPQAQQAFMALNNALKDLQDPVKRCEIDRKSDAKLAKEEYEADLKARKEAAQWRKLRGEEALLGDAELLLGDVKDQLRDEWMTTLPPERQAGGPPSQQNTFFSKTEKNGRGDTSGWTDTPLERAQRAKMQYLESYKQASLEAEGAAGVSLEFERGARSAALIDNYNQKKRSLSLVEEHRQKSVKKMKKSKIEKGVQEESKKNDWAETHPWRPWDREKDLAAGRQSVKLTDEKHAGEGLRSRFGSQSGPRTFL